MLRKRALLLNTAYFLILFTVPLQYLSSLRVSITGGIMLTGASACGPDSGVHSYPIALS